MKNFLCILFACGLISMSSYAQVSYYTFSSATNTFDTLTTGKALTPSTTATGNFYVDSTVAAGGTTATGIGLPIGFTFTYNGTNFDVFGVNANGWISFGQSALTPASVDMTSTTVGSPISTVSTAPAELQNRVSAFGRTLVGQATSQLSYATTGTAPNRVLVVEWKRFRRSTTATTENLNFQIRLHETTNVVGFVYGTAIYAGTNGTVQVGLRGQANTDFLNRTSTTDWSATTAGTAANATIAISATVYPAVGLTYTFTPPVLFPNDAGITLISSPVSPIPTGTANVAVTIKNFGTANLTGATIAWKVNNLAQTAYTYTNAGLVTNATDGPVTIGTYNFTPAGVYTIKAWPVNPNGSTDGNAINDTASTTIYVQGYAALPFSEHFDGTWINMTNTRDVPSVYWVNTPNTGNNSWRRDDDGTSAAWSSGTSGGYTPAGIGGLIHSARFHSRAAAAASTGTLDAFLNFSTAGTKMLKFYHINTSGTDTLSILMSNDGGTNFSLIQKIATSAAWTQYFVSLGDTVAANTIVRFSVTNITTGTGQTDIGIDSVQVYILAAADAGITAINGPSTPVVQGSNPVTVTVMNYGVDSLETATIGWSVNAVSQTPFTYTKNPGLATNATDGPVTIGNYNFTTAGYYTIKAWTSLPNGSADANIANDSVTKVVYVQGYAPLPFAENFNGTWINKVNTRDVPSLYWVNSPVTGNNSWRRDDDGTSAAWANATSGAYTPTGVGTGVLRSARFHSRSATAGTTGTLDALINFTTIGTKALKFWHINTSGTDTLVVSMSNDGGTNYTLIQKFATSTAWTQYFVNLGASTAPNTIIRFSVTNLTSGTGQTDLGIDSVQVYVLAANDAGLTAINAPSTPVTLGSNPVTVTVKNYGASNLTSASIGWSVNTVAQTPYTYSNTGLVTGASDGPVAIGNYNFATSGFYTIKAWSSLPNGSADADNTNDTVSKVIYAQAYATIPFIEGFDSTWINKNATKDVPTDYWANNPSTGDRSWRRDDDSLSGAWTEGASGIYTPAGANGTIHSARFHTWTAANNTNGILDLFVNLSPTGGKILDFWNINPTGNDSLSVYLSTDGGTTFSLVQKFQTATAWTQHLINIGTSTSSTCVIRFKAISDYGQDDYGIDQVQVYLQPSIDMTALDWVSPVSGCGLTNAESVTVRVINTGLAAQSNIPVKYSINGGTTIVGPEYITGPVNPGDTATYTFTAKANFATPGTYPCGFAVKQTGDALAINDSAFIDISSVSAISGIPFTDSLEAGNLHYILAKSTNSNVTYASGVGNASTSGFDMTGGAASTWPSGSSTTTTGPQAFSYTDHVATINSCQINATSVTGSLYMKFDLMQTHSSGPRYSFFAVAIGTDTLTDAAGTKFFNPATASSDPFASKLFDLSAYAGTNFNITFMSSCKYNDATFGGISDHAYLDNIILYIPPTINDLGADTSFCEGNSITYDAGAGTGYTYVWTLLPAGTVVGTSQTLTVSTSGTYQVVVTNAAGYSATDNVTVTVIAAPVVNAGTDASIATGTSTTLSGSVTPTSVNYVYSWTPAGSLVDATILIPTTTTLTVTTVYTLQVTDTVTGCSGSDQVIITVTGGTLSVTASSTPDTICSGSSAQLLALPSGGSGTYTYTWTPSTGLSSTSIANPVANPTTTTAYTVVVSDGSGSASATVTVNVKDCSGLNEYDNNTSVNIYPNPTCGMTTIEISGLHNIADLSICTLQGQLIFNKKINGNNVTSLDLSNLPKGIYIIRVNNEKTNLTSKLIVQ
jgi:hypothetical protein